jgi:hypothetical protein
MVALLKKLSEVACSQRSKARPELAQIYIPEGHRGSQLVIALDQDLSSLQEDRVEDLEATNRALVRYRASSVNDRTPMSGRPTTLAPRCDVLLSVTYRNFKVMMECLSQDSGLQIPIADFAPKALVPESLHDESIVIPSEEFCHDLHTMERSQEMRAANKRDSRRFTF